MEQGGQGEAIQAESVASPERDGQTQRYERQDNRGQDDDGQELMEQVVDGGGDAAGQRDDEELANVQPLGDLVRGVDVGRNIHDQRFGLVH